MTAILDGHCPACGHRGLLTLTRECRVECINVGCPAPDALQTLIDKPDPHVHLIMFSTDGYTVQHPLLERTAHGRMCALEPEFVLLREAPGIGLYLVPTGGTLADMVAVPDRVVNFEVPLPEPLRPTPPRAPVGTVTAWREPVCPEGWVMLNDDENRSVPKDCEELLAAIAAGSIGWDYYLADGAPALPAVGPDTGLAGATEFDTLGAAQEVDENFRLIMRVR